jgi:hypothetical protein
MRQQQAQQEQRWRARTAVCRKVRDGKQHSTQVVRLKVTGAGGGGEVTAVHSQPSYRAVKQQEHIPLSAAAAEPGSDLA